MIPEDEYTRKKAINLIIICSCLLFHVFANCFEIVLGFFHTWSSKAAIKLEKC